ncbi:MAG: DUF349 domain-containing protein [Actinomycetales bacterium]|nr:DUF349 domain-containing protein [Actinomycetales bacterium]
MSEQELGRVDEAGNVYVITESGERLVGQYADVPAEEALAFFTRKFADVAQSVVLLEQRVKRAAPANEIKASLATVRKAVDTGVGVGDFSNLSVRLDKVSAALSELGAEEVVKNTEATDAAKADRLAIVEAMEALAGQDPLKVQWKQATATADELFAKWQEHQKSAPRLSKTESNELWKRFRDARSTIDQHRRSHFAELDSRNKGARAAKEALVAKADELAAAGPGGIPKYRALLDEWKISPRAGKKIDDALWARFKAAGDILYGAKAEENAVEDESFAANLAVKLGLLTEAEKLISITDRVHARQSLNVIQKKWDAAGKVPRAQVKSVEDRMRKVEAAVRGLEDNHWNASNPEKQARSEGLAGQLETKIGKLEVELAAAQVAKNTKSVKELTEAISTQKAWLAILK